MLSNQSDNLKLESLFIIFAIIFAVVIFAQPLSAQEDQIDIPPPTIDTNGDGIPDAWDRDGDGRADAWDVDGDNLPDKFDNDGDGIPDEKKSPKKN